MALWEYLWSWSGITKWLYHLNWNANDDSWNGNNGTATNITWVWWKLGSGAASFNGSNSQITLPNSVIISGNNPRTILAWVKYSFRDTGSAIFSSIFWWWVNVNWQDFHFLIVDDYWNDNELRLYVRRMMNDQRSISIKSLINDGKRHLVWVTYDWTSTWGSTDYNAWIRFYVDWNQIKRDVSTWWNTNVTFNTQQANATIWWPWAWINYFKWLIDEVIVENRAWTAAEIKKYYTASLGRRIN